MIISLFRFLKRLAILVPALLVSALAAFNIFPLLNDQLPLLVAALLTYLLAAYILIPFVIRLLRILFPPEHLPLYCVTADGFASDPLNIAVAGTRQQVIDAMQAAGWLPADRLTPRSVVRTVLSVIYHWNYPTAPMSNLYLFGRKQDLAFQRPIKDIDHGRHHVRFWAANYSGSEHLTVRSIDWQHREAHVKADNLLWVAAASQDIGVTFNRHNWQFTHLVDADTDAERDILAEDLLAGGRVEHQRNISLGEPYRIMNIHALRGHIRTDGKMRILVARARKTG